MRDTKKSIMKTKSLKLVMLAVALLSVVSVKAQTFVGTDITFSSYGKEVSPEYVRNAVKEGMLGSIWKLEEYDNNVRFSTENNGIDGEEKYLLKKIEPYKYQKTGNAYSAFVGKYVELKIILKIQPTLGYYSSCQLFTYMDGKLLQTATFKRK